MTGNDPARRTIEEDYLNFLREKLPLLKDKKIPFWRRTRDTKLDTLRYCLKREKIDSNGIIAEFGVWKGKTIRMIANRYSGRPVYGFDSFEGFPDDGRKDWQRDFSLSGNAPEVPGNVILVKGFFEQTLPKFVEENQGNHFSLIHIDCDIYSSTKTIFTMCRDLIKPGCLIIFDELLHYSAFIDNEMRAFFEFIKNTGKDFEWVAIRKNVILIDDFLCPPEHMRPVLKDMKTYRKFGYEQEVALRII